MRDGWARREVREVEGRGKEETGGNGGSRKEQVVHQSCSETPSRELLQKGQCCCPVTQWVT